MSDTNNSGGASAPSDAVNTESASVDSNTEEVSNQPQDTTQVATPKPPNIKKYKVKVDGQDVEESLNLDDEEAIKRHIQMSKAAMKRMNEAAMTKKQAENFIRRLQQDPVSVLTDPNLGVNFREVAEKYLLSQIQDEMLSPEQKRVQQAEKIIREREQEQKKLQEQREAQEMAQLQSHYANEHDRKISEALSSSGLPKTPRTVKRMAELMFQNLNMGLNLQPSQLVQIVKEDYYAEMRELFGASEGDMLLNILGDDVANKIRKHDLAKLRAGQPSFAQRSQSAPAPKEETKRMSKEEWKEYLDKKVRS